MRRFMFGLTAALVISSAASAQAPTFTRAFELRPFVGMYVPTGDFKDEFQTATTFGLQGAYQVNRWFHVVATGSWTHGHNKFSVTDDVTHIWQYDVGGELGLARTFDESWGFYPFLGFGAGGRTYDYAQTGFATNSCTAGYGSIGSELRSGPLGLRFEARGYAVCFKSPVTGERKTHPDLGFGIGAAFHF